MTKPHIFFLDVDGTLLARGSKRISDENINKIRELKRAGHVFVVCTGRVLSHALKLNDLDAFDYLSVLFGSRIYNLEQNKLIFKAQGMKKKDLLPFTHYLKERNLMWSYKDECVEKTLFEELTEIRKDKKYIISSETELEKDILNEDIIQLLVLGKHSDEFKMQFKQFNFFDMPGNYTDVTNAKISKAICVEHFKKLYPDYVTVAIGDSQNDLAMFEACDVSVAMGNASPEIKERATFVTKDVNDHGVAWACDLVLGGTLLEEEREVFC